MRDQLRGAAWRIKHGRLPYSAGIAVSGAMQEASWIGISKWPPGGWQIGEVEERLELPEKQAEEIEGELRAEAPKAGASLWRRGAHPRTAGARTNRSAAFSQRPAGGQLLWTVSERRAQRGAKTARFDY